MAVEAPSAMCDEVNFRWGDVCPKCGVKTQSKPEPWGPIPGTEAREERDRRAKSIRNPNTVRRG